MLRTTTARPFFKGLIKVNTTRSSFSAVKAASKSGPNAQVHSLSAKRPKALGSTKLRPVTITLLRYATGRPKVDQIDKEAEAKIGARKYDSYDNDVSTTSSVATILDGGSDAGQQDSDMLAGIRSDLETIKETFTLNNVPREALYIGFAGVLPYLATSLSTVGLAYDINHAHTTGQGIIFAPETAHHLLAILEPIQIGYGAVILSFLGAIHWGLEYAGYGGYQKYNRYAIGVVAPAIAWPTLIMPVEYALITQFLAFNFLYFADARATGRGWCPAWYSTYRFVLTFIVGASIVVSLVGRGQIISHDGKLPGPNYRMMIDLRESQWDSMEQEEREKQRRHAEEDTEHEADDSEGNKEEDD